MRHPSPRLARLVAATLLLVMPAPARAQPATDAWPQLLQALRDRGAITLDQFEALQRAAPPVTEPPTAGVALPAVVQSAVPAVPQPADDGARNEPAGRWYERLSLRGYTQFRIADVFSSEGAPLDVPADRSVSETESFIIRRGRFILSGNVTDHLAIYAQPDFNASTGAADFSLQMRDLYADVFFDKAKTVRLRLGQSKVPFGFANLQSSQQRGPLERADALNFAVEGERDLGVYVMWAPAHTRALFADLLSRGLKGSGDYGVIAIGAYNGQGANRPDQNGTPHWVARASYPLTLASSQIVELGVQGYTGRFVTPQQPIAIDGATVTPERPAEGLADRRVALSAVWYPQPLGVEVEWNWGRGPELTSEGRQIIAAPLNGGYVQLHYRHAGAHGTWFPFARWQYYDGGRKFARNAPHAPINEWDLGLKFARWAEVEFTGMYTHTVERARTNAFPYSPARNADRVGVQVQWNY